MAILLFMFGKGERDRGSGGKLYVPKFSEEEKGKEWSL